MRFRAQGEQFVDNEKIKTQRRASGKVYATRSTSLCGPQAVTWGFFRRGLLGSIAGRNDFRALRRIRGRRQNPIVPAWDRYSNEALQMPILRATTLLRKYQMREIAESDLGFIPGDRMTCLRSSPKAITWRAPRLDRKLSAFAPMPRIDVCNWLVDAEQRRPILHARAAITAQFPIPSIDG